MWADWTGVGIGGVLVIFAVHVLWQQGKSWGEVLAAAQDDARIARLEAAAAREDAAAAREAEQECRRRLALVESRLDKLEGDNRG